MGKKDITAPLQQWEFWGPSQLTSVSDYTAHQLAIILLTLCVNLFILRLDQPRGSGESCSTHLTFLNLSPLSSTAPSNISPRCDDRPGKTKPLLLIALASCLEQQKQNGQENSAYLECIFVAELQCILIQTTTKSTGMVAKFQSYFKLPLNPSTFTKVFLLHPVQNCSGKVVMHAAGTSLEPSNIHMGVCNYPQCSTGISVLSLFASVKT